MSKPVPINVCPHCAELAITLHACGVLLEATSQHHAMALIRSMHAEGRTLAEVVELLGILEHATELVPPPDAPKPVRSVPYPVAVSSTGAIAFGWRSEENV
jgi:hypothetical protein